MDASLESSFEGPQFEFHFSQNDIAETAEWESLRGNVPADAELIKIDDPPKFDLESYITNYVGRTRFARLFLIGTRSSHLSIEALKLAVSEAKSGKDVPRYEAAVSALAEASSNDKEAVLDAEWVKHMQKATRAETDRLEQELRGYKNNLIKESIRMGNEDLGSHYHQIGDLVSASKAYSRMRDYCTTPSHVAAMLLKIIALSIERGDWLGVQSNVYRLRSLQSKPEELAKSQPKTSAALELSQLQSGSYLDAANSFLATDPSLGDSYNDIITPNDVAIYGGLCALASMDRNELQRRVLDNSSFRNFLELEPHIRRAISFYCNSKFKPCLEILEAYRADYLLDIYLYRHVSFLYSRIRTKSIQQYIIPFSCVTLDAMSKTFSIAAGNDESEETYPRSPLVQELIRLIQDGTLNARIDLEKKVLVSKKSDLHAEVQEAALKSLLSYTREAHLRLLRTNIIQAGLEVRASPGERKPETEGRSIDRSEGKATWTPEAF